MNNRHNYAFTLIEMLVVIAIIVILAGISSAVFLRMSSRAEREGEGNQVKKVLGALEQFKVDFGEYPTVDLRPGVDVASTYTSLGTYSTNNPAIMDGSFGSDGYRKDYSQDYWASNASPSDSADSPGNSNSLAYRLCQGTTDVIASTVNRNDRSTWTGSYLEEDDISKNMIVGGRQILDIWETPLSYYGPTEMFFAAQKNKVSPGGALLIDGASVLSTTVDPENPASAIKSPSLSTNTITPDFMAYRASGQLFGGRTGGCNLARKYLPSISYVLKGNWVHSDMSRAEVWSYGSDKRVSKMYYNGTTCKDTVDEDNVGGNQDLMHIN